MMSSLLSPSCVSMVSLRIQTKKYTLRAETNSQELDYLSACILGIDEDDEHEEEDEERVGLLEIGVPQRLGNFRKAMA